MNAKGCLYIVATPIGNLKDITLRALEVLHLVDGIAAEDTRHSAYLLNQYDIKVPMVSLHAHNEVERNDILLQRLKEGESIALISDAGTPLIHDPGFPLVRAARQAGVQVIPIPGATALITALCASGLPAERFIFEGFLAAKHSARREQLKKLFAEERTMIFYESPHRIVESIKDMQEIFGTQREAVIARELTKTFETLQSGTLSMLSEWLQVNPDHRRGEFVVLVSGAKHSENEEIDASALEILKILLAELPVKQAAHLTAKITGKRKNELYQWAVKHFSK